MMRLDLSRAECPFAAMRAPWKTAHPTSLLKSGTVANSA
jgi:hypothetical protein